MGQGLSGKHDGRVDPVSHWDMGLCFTETDGTYEEGVVRMANHDADSRLQAFEQMLASIQMQYNGITDKMERLKSEGREKTATYRQLMGQKMQLQNMLMLYRLHGLMDDL